LSYLDIGVGAQIPAGNISVSVIRRGGKGAAVVADIPNGIKAYLVWNQKRTQLKAGKNNF